MQGDWVDEDGQIQWPVLLQPHQDIRIDVAGENCLEIWQGMGTLRRVLNVPKLNLIGP